MPDSKGVVDATPIELKKQLKGPATPRQPKKKGRDNKNGNKSGNKTDRRTNRDQKAGAAGNASPANKGTPKKARNKKK